MNRFQFQNDAGTQTVEFHYDAASGTLQSGGESYPCDGETVVVDGRRLPFAVHRRGDTVEVALDGIVYRFETIDPRRRDAEGDQRGPSSGRLCAEMPGKVLSLAVAEGDSVDPGQTLLVMESMKMELAVQAPFAGVVESVAVKIEQMVTQGDLLVSLTEDQECEEREP